MRSTSDAQGTAGAVAHQAAATRGEAKERESGRHRRVTAGDTMLEQVARVSRMLARRVLAAGVCQKLANLTSAHANIERSLIMGDATGRQEFARLSRTAFAWEPVVETARKCQSSIERLDELDSEEAQASSASAQDDDERALMDELIAESREVSRQARRARFARRVFVTRARAHRRWCLASSTATLNSSPPG